MSLRCRHSEIVTWLLQQGANPMLFDSIHSRVCLHYAALYGQVPTEPRIASQAALHRLNSALFALCGPGGLSHAHIMSSSAGERPCRPAFSKFRILKR